jgi:hypothetical protein
MRSWPKYNTLPTHHGNTIEENKIIKKIREEIERIQRNDLHAH